MVEIKNITKFFGTQKVIDDVSLKIEKGDIIGIIGASGSGKSTFIRCIEGLDNISSGKIIKKAESTMIFQNFNLFENMSAIENIMYPMMKKYNMKQDLAKKKASELLSKFNMQDKSNIYPHKLSGGQKQRIAILRAISINPDIILFDEPTSALDPYSVADILDLIYKLSKNNITMMIVSHEITFLKKISNTICFFDKGKIIEKASAKVFFTKPKSVIVKNFFKNLL